MPALTDLESRMSSDPEWGKTYNVSINRANTIAALMPLVHVTGKKDGAPFKKLVSNSPPELPTSDESAGYCSNGTRWAEDVLDLGRCLYFYAGRAHPRFGDVALAFPATCEEGRNGGATPYDTGGLAHGYIDTNLPADLLFSLPPTFPLTNGNGHYISADLRSEFATRGITLPSNSTITETQRGRRWLVTEGESQWYSIRKNDSTGELDVYRPILGELKIFTQRSQSPLPTWREAFARFLAAYFNPLSDYFDGRPWRSDIEELFVRNDDWRAWTWEVRFHEPHSILDAEKWCTTEEQMAVLEDILNDEVSRLDESLRSSLKQFHDRAEVNSDPCLRIEQQVKG